MPSRNYKQELEKQFTELKRQPEPIGGAHASRVTVLQVSDDLKPVFEIADDDHALQTLFNESGLDPTNLYHWRVLLEIVAGIFYAPRRQLGAPERWTRERYQELFNDAPELWELRRSETSSRIAERLTKDVPYRDRWGSNKPASIRARLRTAAQILGADWKAPGRTSTEHVIETVRGRETPQRQPRKTTPRAARRPRPRLHPFVLWALTSP